MPRPNGSADHADRDRPRAPRTAGPLPTDERLEGLVELITFHSEETGFCVLKVKARGFRETIAVVGKVPRIAV